MSKPPGSVELPLAAYKAAMLLSVGGMVTSRGIEPRSLGLQPSAMTTPARWSGWSRRRGSNPRLRLTGAPCFRQHFVDVAVGPGFEPGSFRLTAGRVAVATTLQAGRIEVVGSGGLEPPRACARGRWAADYPTTRRTSWGERPESNRLERVSQTRGAPFAFAHRRIGSR